MADVDGSKTMTSTTEQRLREAEMLLARCHFAMTRREVNLLAFLFPEPNFFALADEIGAFHQVRIREVKSEIDAARARTMKR